MNAATLKAPMILPTDVLLVPEAELPDDLRQGLEPEPEDVAVTRPRSRAPSRLVDSDGAALLARFRVPTTIVEAIIAYSREQGLDPEEALDRSYPMFQSLLLSRLLVPADSPDAVRIVPAFEVGRQLPVGTVVRCVQVLDDTELYQLQRADGERAALKILRRGRTADGASLAREAALLEQLDGRVNPRLLDAGALDELPYVLIEWCPGAPASIVADELRRLPSARDRLLRLCREIVAAYVHLHAQCVLHADVHPRNILIGRHGAATIIDYGLARLEGGDAGLRPAERGGVAFYLEPEYAAAVLAGRTPPPASFAGEQYALGALLYQLIAGDHHCRFPPERDALLREILTAPVLPFSARGAMPWREMEEILQTALAKDPRERFASIACLEAALDRVPAAVTPAQRGEPVAQAPSGDAARVLADVLRRVGADGPAFTSGPAGGPRCSLNYGGAGISYMVHRVAAARDDADLLSLADLWIHKALDEQSRSDAFCDPRLELTPEVVGRVSPYHTLSGVHAVHAMVAHALGDSVVEEEAVAGFLSLVEAPGTDIDLTLGGAGVLLACAELLEQRPGDDDIRARGEALVAGVWRGADVQYLGIAHGWAGVLFATMRWCQAAGCALPGEAAQRLDELASAGHEVGRGMRWPILARDDPGDLSLSAGWCHGSAGYVLLWTLAYDLLGRDEHLRLAESAAWNVWESPHPTSSLCCGLAGQSYALLSWYRHVREADWLYRARELAARAASAALAGDGPMDSLYKGRVGVALLASDLTRPESARMPFFESDCGTEREGFEPSNEVDPPDNAHEMPS